MFKEIGALAGLMKNLPKIKEEVDRLQQRLGQISAEGTAGGGMVKMRVTGKMEVTSCTISPEAMADPELLEDLIRAATNQALERARQQVSEETAKMATGLGLPPGMALPGMPMPGG
jgi:DNA-binding YbaB/EbfC family protein